MPPKTAKRKTTAKKPKATAKRTSAKKVAYFRTKVANGVSLFMNGAVDERTMHARRFREIIHDISSDLGGADALSAVQKQLIRRNAALCVLAEGVECDLAAGKDIDAGVFVTLCNAQNRISTTIGLTRAVLDVTPSLRDLLAAKAAEEAQQAEDDEEAEGAADAEV
jgi:hypothetical protein